ncbi:mediator of RNA polymerase II transcription subunit 12-like [Pyrus ussuriensis x Pyrus communis]|uniref:Mediator of RNA polymerase II transcription subunit 12-like n=1 Tax=Pyrus ussuriensis x Pyrus communis TaxID=2448454 RepID=A0A5N5G441_9ROSA|nr:mediator of RNA polymerase II transcription subunit 12-like [Pyrus ussuriensis x Pyrus communis]
MHRYHAPGCTSAVNNTTIGGTSGRDSTRAESAALPNLPLASRRTSQLNPYKLKCDKDPLNSRLGPPDFHPQTPNCPEETLTKEYVQAGYRETVEGIEESRELSLSQAQAFSKPLLVFRCKEAIKKRFRAINESRAQKRKAGQVYGVPLVDSLLSKPGVFPEQKPCGEELRKKWIEGLSQQHKRLRSLADHVPHGYRKRSLFEVLTRNNVPLLRATWFIKVNYLNQFRPGSTNISSGTSDKAQLSRTELWTKDIIDYLQYLLDELFSRNNSHSTSHNRDRSPQILYAGSQRGDPASAVLDGEEPSVHFKWWYVVRLLQWHHAEGLLLPTLIIEWVLSQLQDKELLEIMQLFLPIIYGVLETVVLSQTYVRNLVRVAVRFIGEPSQGGSDHVDNSRRGYTVSSLVEMLRYLILAVPDTFVAFDCFPLPSSIVSYVANDGLPKMSEDARKIKKVSAEVASAFRSKVFDTQYQSLAFDHIVSSIQKHAENLAKAARPSYPGHSIAKAVQALDRSLVQGDVRVAFRFLFEDPCDGVANESWIAGVSPCLQTSLKWIGTANLSFVCAVFFLCEWATCDFRDFTTAPPCELKFTGRKDFSQVFVVTRLLKLKMRDLQLSPQRKNDSILGVSSVAKGSTQQNNFPVRVSLGNSCEVKPKNVDQRSMKSSNIFESPGPLHDIIVCWIDQHEAGKGEGLKRLQLLLIELIRSGIFNPHAYVRQLIVSGIMDMNGPVVEVDRWKRHFRILKLLPGLLMHDALEEAGIAEGPQLSEAMNFYSTERRLILRGLLSNQNKNVSVLKQKHYPIPGKDGGLPVSVDQWKAVQPSPNVLPGKSGKTDADVEELKEAISVLLQFPNSSSPTTDTGLDESQGSVKRPFGSIYNKMDLGEGTPGCEECRRAKRQKVSGERSSCIQGKFSIPSDDEDTWWMRKRPKSLEPLKVDPPVKSTKQVSRNRQKIVRKTQSLAQLAAARIEGSQGASTSHVCNNKVSCPHHKSGVEGETPKSIDPTKMNHGGDIVSIGKALKQLRFVEKRTITVWLMTVIRQLVEETEKTIAKVGQFGRTFTSVDDRSSMRWKLGEDELSAALYLMDVSNDLVSAVKFLLWLLPKVSGPSSPIHSGRNIMLLPRNAENQVCELGEAFLVSSLRRYENILVATDLIPEVLSVTMHRASAIVAPNGRVSGSAALAYSRYLLKRYSNVASVIEWEKNFKPTCDKRLLSELESGQSVDGELGFPLGVPAGVEDLDDFFRQKISGVRLSRVGMNMKEIVQRNVNVDDAFQYFFGKERKLFAAGAPKGSPVDKWDDGCQISQKVITELMDCIRQTGGAAQEGDPSLVSSAVSAIVGNVGLIIAKIPDFRAGGSYSTFSSATDSLNFARRILRIHISCLCLLKEALGERQTRVFEVALATEACSALAPGKASRNQYQSSPESHDSNTNMSNDILNSKVVLGRTTKVAAAVSALIIGAVVQGVTSLERLVTVFRLKERLDVIQFVRSSRSNSNGNARSAGAFKGDNSLEAYVHWFRLLVGNCRTVSDGLVVELLGEPSVVALSRMQRMLPLGLVFPPAYSIFAFVMWRPFLLSTSFAARDDFNQSYQSLTTAIGDAIKHSPFRDVCLRDSQGFYDLVAADGSDAEFAAMLELNGSDMHIKSKAFIPLRARLFLNAIMDCKMPHFSFTQGEANQVSGHGESKVQFAEHETKLVDKLVHILDTLQPAKFHWQWVELRLLLNEQALNEKLGTQDASLVDAIRLSSPSPERAAASENEKYFIEIILTRLLVRPDAAPLFSDVVHLFGRSLADSMLLQVKWFLGGSDVLYGRKTIRQRLLNIAESKGLSIKTQFWKPWGWCSYDADPMTNRGDKRKFEVASLEEGEMVEEGTDSKKYGKGATQTLDIESYNVTQQHVTERALIELLLPCIDQSSDESRNTFANDLIKQLGNIEQQVSPVTRGTNKQAGPTPSGVEGPTSKGNSRKGIRGGSPGLARRVAGAADSGPPSPAALRASVSLRLQLLLRLLPVICADREPSGRNMRHGLASVVLRLLGNRVVHEGADLCFNIMQSTFSKRDAESSREAASAAFAELSNESLFDQLLFILHGLLSSCRPSWLRSTKSINEGGKDFAAFDCELADIMQKDLDRMQLPEMIRWRIQTAMPVVIPSVQRLVSCQPPPVPDTALAILQPSILVSGLHAGSSNPPQKNQAPLARTVTNVPGKFKPLPSQDYDMDIDPWTLLEDGAGSGPSSSTSALIGSVDHGNLRASSWLKGAVRVRRKDLTYIGAVDDDS